MPVVLLGGELFVARAAASALLRVSPEVRVLVPTREDAEPLRALGVKVAVGEPDDPDLLDTVFSGAHTVCLLGATGRWWDEHDADGDAVGVLERTLDRARSSRIERLVAVAPAASATRASAPASAPAAPTGHDRGAAAWQSLVEESGIPSMVVRTNLPFGAGSPLVGLLAAMARARPVARVVGTGSQRWAPVFVEDLARVLAAADDRSEPISGTFGLDGPDVVTAGELVDLLAGRRRPVRRHVTGGVPRVMRDGSGDVGIRAAAVRYLSGDVLAGPPSAAEELGIELTPLREALARSLG